MPGLRVLAETTKSPLASKAGGETGNELSPKNRHAAHASSASG